jgi:hypothetical protein
MRLYRRMGAISVICEHNHGASPASDFDELHSWLLSKLIWNPDRDDRALVREFLDGYYGPAGRALAGYQELLANRVGQTSIFCYWGPRVAEDWLDLDTMNRATELFDEAAAWIRRTSRPSASTASSSSRSREKQLPPCRTLNAAGNA